MGHCVDNDRYHNAQGNYGREQQRRNSAVDSSLGAEDDRQSPEGQYNQQDARTTARVDLIFLNHGYLFFVVTVCAESKAGRLFLKRWERSARAAPVDPRPLQLSLPSIFGELEKRRSLIKLLRLEPFPKASLTEFSSQLILPPEPLLDTFDAVGVDFIEQRVIPLDDLVFPDVPKAGEVVPETHRAFVIRIGVVSGRQASRHLERAVPVRVQIRVDVSR